MTKIKVVFALGRKMTEIQETIYKRKIIEEILPYLSEKETIILYGARQVGKTFILYWLERYLKEKREQVFFLDLEETRYLELLNQGPEALRKLLIEQGFDLERKIFVLVDEIQYLENPSNFLKLATDHYRNLKLIVSGSSTFELRRKAEKALVGRALIFEVFGLSFEEFLTFKGYSKPPVPILTSFKEEEIKELFKEFVLFGSYPKIALISGNEKKEKYLWQIVDTYLKKDIRDLAGVEEIDKFNKLLEVLASQTGNLLNVEELANTCRLAKQTVDKYLFVLENTYVVKLVRPFFKNLRSELFKTPKVYFYDSGLAQLLWLKVIPREIMGGIFETAVFGELVKKFGKEAVNFWRTKDKKEIDFILKFRQKTIPIEVKVNFASISQKPIEYFLEKYKLKEAYFVGLKGEKGGEEFLLPWEIGLLDTQTNSP